MIVRILVVEDTGPDYERLEAILRALPSSEKTAWEITDIQIVRAANAKDALRLIEKGVKSGEPFDVIVLDLAIPDSDGPPHTDHGFKVLRFARKLHAAHQIVIYTQFAIDPNILRALREGATDFVEKPRALANDDQELRSRFATCWQRIREDASATLLEERIKNLVPYAESGLAQRYTACFSTFLQQVAQTSEDVKHYAMDRFGLDLVKDSQDYLIRCLRDQDEDISTAKRNWVNLNANLLNGEGAELTPIPLRTLLDSIHSKWSPCLFIKNYRYVDSVKTGAGVLTFHQDVRIIIQEIIAGALSLLPDYGTEHKLEITAELNDGQVAIRFSDNLSGEFGITAEDASVINDGLILGPDHGRRRFGRSWGLSVAQHLALRGGGRLIVEPRRDGSTITYFAPSQTNPN